VITRGLITISESFIHWFPRVVLVAGCLLTVAFAIPCFPAPAFTGVVFVCANAMAIVGFTAWHRYEHEFATAMLTGLFLVIQITICVLYLRQDPFYPQWVYITLLCIQLAVGAFFALHLALAHCIRTAPLTIRPRLAWFERERLSVMEWINVVSFVVTVCLVRS